MIMHMGKYCLLVLSLLLAPSLPAAAGSGEPVKQDATTGEEEIYEFPGQTDPLLESSFFRQGAGIIIPVSGVGLASGITLLLLGIINFSTTAETGYGSVEMNRSMLMLNSGILVSAVSVIFLKAALDAVLG